MVIYNLNFKGTKATERVEAQEVGIHPSGALIFSNGGQLLRLVAPGAWQDVSPSVIQSGYAGPIAS